MESEEHYRERMQKLRAFNRLKNGICKGAIADYEKLELSVCTNPRDVVMEICCALHNFRVRLSPWQPMA